VGRGDENRLLIPGGRFWTFNQTIGNQRPVCTPEATIVSAALSM
jgi:hypothetical protein